MLDSLQELKKKLISQKFKIAKQISWILILKLTNKILKICESHDNVST